MSSKKVIKLKKIILIIITLVISVVAISGVYVYHSLDKLSKSSDKKQLNSLKRTRDKNDNSINILALGVDIGDPKIKSDNVPKRTDTMMLIHYNPTSEEVSIVSIPRDTLIKINKKNFKINAAHAVGGVDYSIDAVEKLLDIDIDYYGKIDYKGFREIIDSIGGVDIEINRNMNYDDESQDLHIHFKKGEKVHLDGAKAEQFFRWRKNNDGTGLADGDIGRIDNQHVFVQKVLEKLKSPKIIPRIPGILTTIPKYCETNMSADEMVKYGYNFITANKIETNTLKGEFKYISGISYLIYDKKLNKEILSKIHQNSSLNEDSSLGKNNMRIQVLNCTKKNGLAANYKKYLNEKGYNSVSTGNSTAKDQSVIYFNNVDNATINMMKKDLNIKKYEIIDDNSKNFDIIILLGKNFTNKNIK
ncbi:LCP family protein [Clostridium sp. MB40-C1]|uniref:LCP family protein n=1 Tax=Clostridium sp. MB40-C1 TaxID=3070996 RepID=UPI0027DF8F83|nr:LCP family protein [Clostridium sp. MB40-C1]WMJ82333.1 LCP family protein [Clostridium sp. MB40-C1]